MSARFEREGKTSVFSIPELDDRTPSALEEPGRIGIEVGSEKVSYGIIGGGKGAVNLINNPEVDAILKPKGSGQTPENKTSKTEKVTGVDKSAGGSQKQ